MFSSARAISLDDRSGCGAQFAVYHQQRYRTDRLPLCHDARPEESNCFSPSLKSCKHFGCDDGTGLSATWIRSISVATFYVTTRWVCTRCRSPSITGVAVRFRVCFYGTKDIWGPSVRSSKAPKSAVSRAKVTWCASITRQTWTFHHRCSQLLVVGELRRKLRIAEPPTRPQTAVTSRGRVRRSAGNGSLRSAARLLPFAGWTCCLRGRYGRFNSRHWSQVWGQHIYEIKDLVVEPVWHWTGNTGWSASKNRWTSLSPKPFAVSPMPTTPPPGPRSSRRNTSVAYSMWRSTHCKGQICFPDSKPPLYRHVIETIRSSAFGSLTVRTLLDMREHCLNEVDFPDPYLQVLIHFRLYKSGGNNIFLIFWNTHTKWHDAAKATGERRCDAVTGRTLGSSGHVALAGEAGNVGQKPAGRQRLRLGRQRSGCVDASAGLWLPASTPSLATCVRFRFLVASFGLIVCRNPQRGRGSLITSKSGWSGSGRVLIDALPSSSIIAAWMWFWAFCPSPGNC